MKTLFSLIISCAVCLGWSSSISAADHILGTKLTYEPVAGASGTYLVTLKLYSNCGNLSMDPDYDLIISSSCSTAPPLTVSYVHQTEVSDVCQGTYTECSITPGTNPAFGVVELTYTGLLDMNPYPTCADWTISFNACCRYDEYLNLFIVPTKALYTIAVLNSGIAGTPIVNSSPTVLNTTVPYICLNDTVFYNPQASDSDGDSLVYSLISAKDIYTNVVAIPYQPGYSYTQPFGNVPFSFDIETGQFRIIPDQLGAFAVVVKIDEFRTINGVITKVGSSQLDLHFQVMNCATLCVQTGNTLSINNGNTTAGADEVIATMPGQPLSISILAASQSSVQLSLSSSDHQTVAPGSTFITTGSGNQITGHFSWTPTAAQVRNQPYFIHYRVTDNACPVSNDRDGVLRVQVSNSILSADQQLTATTWPLPSVLRYGEVLRLPEGLTGSTLRVYSMAGQLIFEKQAYHDEFKVLQPASGIYFYQVQPTGTDRAISAKLVIAQ